MQRLVRLLCPVGKKEHHTCSILWVHHMWGLHQTGECQVRNVSWGFLLSMSVGDIYCQCQLGMSIVNGVSCNFLYISSHSELVVARCMQCNLYFKTTAYIRFGSNICGQNLQISDVINFLFLIYSIFNMKSKICNRILLSPHLPVTICVLLSQFTWEPIWRLHQIPTLLVSMWSKTYSSQIHSVVFQLQRPKSDFDEVLFGSSPV